MKVAASPSQKEANPASLRSAAPSTGRGSRGHSLLPMEGGAPKGQRLDGGSVMKKRGRLFQVRHYTRASERREYIGGDARRSAESRFPVYAFLT